MTETNLFKAKSVDESKENADAFIRFAGDGATDLFFAETVRQLFIAVSELLRLYGKNAEVTDNCIAERCNNNEYGQTFKYVEEGLAQLSTRDNIKEMFLRAEDKKDPEFETGLKAWKQFIAHPIRTFANTIVTFHMGLMAIQ